MWLLFSSIWYALYSGIYVYGYRSSPKLGYNDVIYNEVALFFIIDC